MKMIEKSKKKSIGKKNHSARLMILLSIGHQLKVIYRMEHTSDIENL